MAKKTYGKVPPYIVKKNVELKEAKEKYSNYVKNIFAVRAAPVLPEVSNGPGMGMETNGQSRHRSNERLRNIGSIRLLDISYM